MATLDQTVTRPRGHVDLRARIEGLGAEHELAGLSLDVRTTPQPPAAVRELRRRETRYRYALASADAVAATVGVLLCGLLFGDRPAWGLALVPLIAVVVAKVQGLYDRDDQAIVKSNLAEWRRVLQACLLGGIGYYLAWAAITAGPQAKGMRMFLPLVGLTFVWTMAARTVARALARHGSVAERCVVIGDRVQEVTDRLTGLPGVDVVGTLTSDALSGSIPQLRAVVDELGVHRFVIAGGNEPAVATLHLIEAAKIIGVRVSLVPSVMTAVGGFALMEEIDGMTLLGVPRFGLSRSSALLKRGFDLVVGTAALIAFSPLMILIAVAVRCETRGPAIFCQTRIGRGGRPFRIFKFRSMVDGAEAMRAELLARNEAGEGLFKIVGDPRITRVGRLIRSSHLDELPQLVNVLRGEMSLVGPRPLVVEEDDRILERDRHRGRLVPGITGPWQIKGPLSTPLAEMAKLDYRYASSWSIWSDFDILIQTALRVLNRGGH